MMALQAGVGSAQSLGTDKGEIYQGSYDYLIEKGMPEDEARRGATEAQATFGENLPQLFLSFGLGAAAASTGAERVITRMLTRTGKEVSERSIKGVIKGGLKGIAGEVPLETVQEGQEKVATNIALQNLGADVDTFAGVPQAVGMAVGPAAILGGAAGAIEVLTPEQETERKIEKQSTQMARQLTISPTDTTGKVIVNEITKKENAIDNLRSALSSIDPNTPEGQELSTAIKRAETELSTLKKQTGEAPVKPPVVKPKAAKQPTIETGEKFAPQKETAKVLNELTLTEQASMTGRLLSRKLLTRTEAQSILRRASDEGITTDQIKAAEVGATQKWDERTRDGVLAGRVAPTRESRATDIILRTEELRRKKPIVNPRNALKPKDVIGKTAQDALTFAARLNLVANMDNQNGEANWRTGNAPKPNYAMLQDAAAIMANQQLPALQENIVPLSERGTKGRAARFPAQGGMPGVIGFPSTLTETIETLVHEVGHTLTSDTIREYAARREVGSGKKYADALNKAINDSSVPEGVRRLFKLYLSTIEQLGISDLYVGNNGIAGKAKADESLNAAIRLQKSGKLRKDLTRSQLYALANVDEFVSQTFSSQSFRDLLKTLKDPDTKKSLWREFVQAIKEIFGLPSDSMAAAVIETTFDIATPKTLEEKLIVRKDDIVAKALEAGVPEADAELVADEIITKTLEELYPSDRSEEAILKNATEDVLPKVVEQYKQQPTVKEGLTVPPPVSETITEPPAEGEPAPESPEGQSVPEAIANGIDIGPENNMPINQKIDSHLKNFLFVRGFFESAVDRLRRNGFTKLGNAVADYFEGARRRLETANKILLPSFREYSSQRKKDQEQIDKDVKEFFAAQENKRDTEEVRAKMNPVAIKIVDAWQKFGEVSGTENQNVGVKVYDQGKSAWRKIGRVPNFWPRQLKPEYQRALKDNVKYAKEYNEIVQALLDEKKIDKPEDAEKYLRPYRPEAYENDYFSGIEKGRGAALPESLYDYSMQVMTDYVSRWAQHVSRIEQFGQKTTKESKTLWDREMDKVTDQRTRDYIESVRERVVNYFPNDPYIKGMSAMNIWATGLQLGNPASAILNFIGGSTLNAMIGQPGSLSSFIKSLGEMTTDLKGQMLDAQLLAVTSRDLMNIVGDHQVIIDESGFAKAGQKVTDFLLKWSGFTPVEQMVRTQSFIIGKAFLNSTISAYAKNPNGSYARRAAFFLSRNNFDLDKLIVEQGAGPETSRLLRYFANISQGSYTADQVPVFIDNPIGKFLFKYQKFSTQVMRMAWKNTFEPLFKAMTGKGEMMQLPDATRQALYRATLTLRRELGDERRIDISQIPTTVTKGQGRALALIPAMMWLGSAYVGGEVLLRLRDILFGVLMKGPEYEDMLKELEDDDKAAAIYLASERAWYNLIGIGALGLIGNYAQFFFDWQDRERVKNPLDPPALGVLKETATFIQNLYDQKTITAGDIDNFTKSTLSAYRTTQKLGQTIAGWTGREDIPGVKEEMFRREVASINKYSRRWAEEAGIEFRMRRPTEVTPSERTPINRKIAGYLQRGEPQMAAVFAKEYLKGLPKADRLNAIQSISTGARNRQPLRLGSGPMDEVERKAFLRWLKDKVSEERYTRIAEMDKQYQRDYQKFLRMLPNR
jgi:hypothetical protein